MGDQLAEGDPEMTETAEDHSIAMIEITTTAGYHHPVPGASQLGKGTDPLSLTTVQAFILLIPKVRDIFLVKLIEISGCLHRDLKIKDGINNRDLSDQVFQEVLQFIFLQTYGIRVTEDKNIEVSF